MGRRNGILLEDRLCAFCENNGIAVIEDEYHFSLHCPRYRLNTIREKYLKKHLVLYNVINHSNFIEIMTAKNVDLIQDLQDIMYIVVSSSKTHLLLYEMFFLMQLPSYKMCYVHTNILCFW